MNGVLELRTKAFKIWLIENEMNQKQLAARLKINAQTITGYCKNDRFPVIFSLALKGLELELKEVVE